MPKKRRKGKPERVIPSLAIRAWEKARGKRNEVFTYYVQLHYRATGSLVPGCDSWDLQAWLADNILRKEESSDGRTGAL